MSSARTRRQDASSPSCRRLSREVRHRRLRDVSWRLVRRGRTDALMLGRLVEPASVAKPVVYDQFGTRNGLYVEQYVDYMLLQGRKMPGVIEALTGSLQLAKSNEKIWRCCAGSVCRMSKSETAVMGSALPASEAAMADTAAVVAPSSILSPEAALSLQTAFWRCSARPRPTPMPPRTEKSQPRRHWTNLFETMVPMFDRSVRSGACRVAEASELNDQILVGPISIMALANCQTMRSTLCLGAG